MTVDQPERLRADARRNRDQIIAAAKEMFAESGLEVPMEDLAKRAGVGVGTLYRRFPDREALIRAVAKANFAQVLEAAEEAEFGRPTAWQALVQLLGKSRGLRLSMQMALLYPGVWASLWDDPEGQRLRSALMDVVDRLVRAAQDDGELRRDVGAGDVAVLVSLLLKRMPVVGDDMSEMMTDRMLALMLDGLRPHEGSVLPGEILTADRLQAIREQ